MERKSKVLVYLPRKLYVQLHERLLTNHVSYLVSRLLEEFLRATDVRISWTEMENKAEQREYLERKLKEFLSRNGLSAEVVQPPVQELSKLTELSAEPPKPPMQEVPKRVELPTEPPKTAVQSPTPPKEDYTPLKPEPVKESPPTSSDYEGLNQELLRKIESLW